MTATTYVFKGINERDTAWSLHLMLDEIGETNSHAVIFAPRSNKSRGDSGGFAIIVFRSPLLAWFAVEKLCARGYVLEPACDSQGIVAFFDKHWTMEADGISLLYNCTGSSVSRDTAIRAYGSPAQRRLLPRPREIPAAVRGDFSSIPTLRQTLARYGVPQSIEIRC